MKRPLVALLPIAAVALATLNFASCAEETCTVELAADSSSGNPITVTACVSCRTGNADFEPEGGVGVNFRFEAVDNDECPSACCAGLACEFCTECDDSCDASSGDCEVDGTTGNDGCVDASLSVDDSTFEDTLQVTVTARGPDGSSVEVVTLSGEPTPTTTPTATTTPSSTVPVPTATSALPI